MALAGVGLSSCRRPEAHLVPFTKSAEWTIPRKALFYSTAMPRRTGGIPLVVTTHDGRPTKIDGNPLHPASSGATDALAQASVLDLYDPARSRRFAQKVEREENGRKVEVLETRDRAAFETYIDELRERAAAAAALASLFWSKKSIRRRGSGCGLNSKELFRKCVGASYEPCSRRAKLRDPIGFRRQLRLVPHLEHADVVLALDSDFLDCGGGRPCHLCAAFTSRRACQDRPRIR